MKRSRRSWQASAIGSLSHAEGHELRSGTVRSRLPESLRGVFAHLGMRELGRYCNFAYSALACLRMGMSGSASFHRAKKS
jgi:hypothetical protein